MWFGELATSEADGCILAHSLRIGNKRVAKGTQLDQSLIDALVSEGRETVVVARIAPDDVDENNAALIVAGAISGNGLRVDKAHTGRVNIYAEVDGLLCFDRNTVIALNSIDECLTFATLAENSMVLKGRMVATSKIITYAVASSVVEQAVSIAQQQPLQVCAVNAHRAVLVQTRLPTIKESTLDKSYRVTQERLQSRYAELAAEFRCEHTVASLVDTLHKPEVQGADWILVAGASAISDRNDVIPAAITAAGGTVERFGIPLDPGNLLLMGDLGSSTVLGLPGCARSPKYNGLDLFLDRLACNVPITEEWINGLSVGGLLDEDIERPQPRSAVAKSERRAHAGQPDTHTPSAEEPIVDSKSGQRENTRQADVTRAAVAGLVLAAGSSTRAGSVNKLLVKVADAPMVRTIVDTLLHSELESVQVVTGHEHQKVQAALDGAGINCHYCPSHVMGMAHSLSHGISRLPACEAVLVCLADMPHVTPPLINFLLESAGAQVAEVIVVPVYNGKRGNPVIVGKAFFDTLLQHEGDTGARFLMKQYPERVIEIEVADASVVTDYDTVKALDELKALNDQGTTNTVSSAVTAAYRVFYGWF